VIAALVTIVAAIIDTVIKEMPMRLHQFPQVECNVIS